MAKVNKIIIKLIIILTLCSSNVFALEKFDQNQFISLNPSADRKIILEYITSQFKQKSVSQKDLDKLWNNKNMRRMLNMSRFQIVNQKLYAASYLYTHVYFVSVFNYLSQLIKKYKLPDLDFIIFNVDNIPKQEQLLKTTFFMMSKNVNSLEEKQALLMPDAFMISNKWPNLIKKLDQEKEKYSWNQKIEKIFWRGATTGSQGENYYSISNFDKLSRLKIVMLSKLYPQYVDAKFTLYTEFLKNNDGNNLKKVLDDLFDKELSRVPEEEHLKYKYLAAIDGNTCPWLRVPWIMYSNSVLIKQRSSRVEWFYPALKEYIHYIPVENQLTDVLTKLRWMKNNDNKIKQIADNSYNFIKNNLMPEHIEAYMLIILENYSKIQTNPNITPTLISADQVFSLYNILMSFFNR